MALFAFDQENRLEAGCDEAGRGCLAGPVYAAAVILPKGFYHPLLNDSKQVNEAARTDLRLYIQTHALSWAVAAVDVEEIDKLNILQASVTAMHRALAALKIQPEFVLVDGNYFPAYGTLPHRCVVDGDATYASIAAASILAKTHRDEAMQHLHLLHPEYSWHSNKGYPTPAHRAAIRLYGASPHHRRSFRLLPGEEQLQLWKQK